MKKMFRALAVAVLSLFYSPVFSQAPQQFSYQSVVRDNSGNLLTNQSIGIQVSILQGGVNGTPVYVERHFPTSNTNGLVTLSVGNGTIMAGDFQAIDWSSGPYFSKIEIDPTGGTSYSLTSTNQFLSVPYALYAASSGNGQGPTGNGIATTVDNGDGTFTFNYTDGSSFTTSNLTGPTGAAGPQGLQGPAGANGTNGMNGVGISSTVDNGNGTFTFNYTDGSSFTTSNLTGPSGATGATGSQGLQGPAGANGANGTNGVGISSTVDNGNGTFTFNYTDGSSFTTSNLTGPTGATGATGSQGLQGPTGATGPQGPAGNGFTNGTQPGEIKYWDGSAWISLPPSTNNNYYLTFCSGQPMWTNGYCPAEVSALNCASASTTGVVYAQVNTVGVNLLLPYTGGNGGPYSGQSIVSTGVTGLTATLSNGTVVNGNGNLTLAITGIPSGTGTASFNITFGGQTCTFSINVQTLTVGTLFQGGIVAYILQSGDPGYSASEVHGLIAATSDLVSTYTWGCNGVVVGGTSALFGTGMANTTQVTSVCGAGTAAQACDAQTISGYSDWYLPSTDELLAIYPNAGLIGGFSATRYWTSTELNINAARAIDFTTGTGLITSKTSPYPVRPVRSF